MRFAYIDSQGNEVAIPSVDALALRIELGAIGPETELYDAQADRWGPARSHEIYHTLARDAGGEDFLIPSPPPPDADEEDAPEPATPEPPPGAEDLGLTLSPMEEIAPDEPTREPPTPRPEDLRLDLADDLSSADEEPVGGSSSGLDETPMDLGVRDEGADDAEDTLDLEPTLDFGGPVEDAFGEGLDLEVPMSDYDPSTPPAWMEQEGPMRAGDGEPLMDFSAGLDDETDDPARPGPEPSAASDAPPARERPPGSSRPRPMRRRTRRRSGAKPLLMLVLLGALGAGAWYGWQELGERVVPPPPRPAVVIPQIPAELEPPMRAIAADALAEMFSTIEERAFTGEAPQEPSEEWLAGVYLGNASDFGEVARFWSTIRGFADRLGEEEFAAFHEAYVALADSSDLDPEAVPVVVERADSGFLATREARVQTYELLGALADASLSLHEFLTMHEADIQYTPARGFAGNPIEEAVPATQEIGDEMWTLVEDITNALDRLGTLDRVTRERLNAVVLARIRETGIR